jgi:hypothetical protein
MPGTYADQTTCSTRATYRFKPVFDEKGITDMFLFNL